MSIEDIFDEFETAEKEDKAAPLEAPEPSKKSEGEEDSTPKGEDESKEEAEEEAPTPSKADDVGDWFAPAVDEPAVDEPSGEESAGDKPVEILPVEGETAGEIPVEETPAAEATAEVDDEWFVPAPEEPTPTEIPAEASVDMGALVGVKAAPIVVCAVSAEVMRASMQQFQSVKASLLDKKDIATIQNKPFIKRSGWRKLGLAFNLSDEIIKEERDDFEGGFRWRIHVRVWAPNGRSVVGIGACSSEERDFAHLDHDVYATAHTRAKNRALSDMIGSGEVSWEELRGMV